MIDIGRGMHKYGIAYYWGLAQGYTKDGRRIMLNFGDGFGSDHQTLNKASEDYVAIDDKHYKLDVVHMEYTKENYVTPKKFYSAKED